jgi:formylglycine-generating enzyme required for sulfatase activity
LPLAAGAYVLTASAPGRYSTRYPVLVGRAEDVQADIPLPAAADVPPGLLFVPGGTSLLGATDGDAIRTALLAQPQHPVHVDAFFIAEHEVTYGEYLRFLATLPVAERRTRRPHALGLDLALGPTPVLVLGKATARLGEPLCRPTRSLRRCQDWSRFPVAGVSWEDGQAYAAWLASERVPRARLCSEREWERAARGADGRTYAHGDVLRPGDADFDETYQADREQMGVDEVGSFPADVSPFGVLDMNGSVTEWTSTPGGSHPARGGRWSDTASNARAAYTNSNDDDRIDFVGLRICASVAGTPK